MSHVTILKNSQGRLSAERARELFAYDPITGVVTRRIRVSNAPAGAVAGHPNSNRHLQVKIDRVEYLVHRVIWLMVKGEWPEGQLDHGNRVRDDNRWKNLRLATQSENMQNRSVNANNTSGFKGVGRAKCGGRWRARIKASGVVIYLGTFASPEEAGAAYARAAAKVHTRNPAALGAGGGR